MYLCCTHDSKKISSLLPIKKRVGDDGVPAFGPYVPFDLESKVEIEMRHVGRSQPPKQDSLEVSPSLVRQIILEPLQVSSPPAPLLYFPVTTGFELGEGHVCCIYIYIYTTI